MAVPERMPSFLQRSGLRLLLFGGKGGVGKTTCAAAAALCLAARSPDQTFLGVSTDPAHSLRRCLAGCVLPQNLELLEIDAPESFRKFSNAHAHHLRTIAERGTFLDEEDATRLVELSMPGLDEVMAFNDIAALVEAGTHSCIIVDTAPAGHTLRFLGLPKIFRTWLDALDAMLAKHRYMAALYRGAYRKDETDLFIEGLACSVEHLTRLLSDRARCLFVPVMLAEALSVAETRRLVTRLEAMCIPVADIVVNRLYPEASDCPACQEARDQQCAQLSHTSREFADYSLWAVPLQGAEVHGSSQLGAFWDRARSIQQAVNAAGLGSPASAAR